MQPVSKEDIGIYYYFIILLFQACHPPIVTGAYDDYLDYIENCSIVKTIPTLGCHSSKLICQTNETTSSIIDNKIIKPNFRLV